MKKRGRLGLLWDMSKGYRLFYAGSLMFMAAAIFASYLVPQIIMFVVDCVVGGLPMTQPRFVQDLVERVGCVSYLREHILLTALFAIAVSALGGLCNFLRGRLVSVSSQGLIKQLRDALFAHIQKLPYSWHVRVQTGDIIQRCTSDVDVVRNFIEQQLIEMLRTLMLVVFAYIILFSMNPAMALASFLFLPVMLGYSFVFLSKISHRFLKADQAEGQLLSIAQENLTGVRVIRAFGRERYEADRFGQQNELFARLWVRLGSLLSWFWAASDLLTTLQMLTICAVGAFQATSGKLTVGAFIVFLSYNSMTIWPVRGLGRVLSEASKTGVSMGRILEILDEPIEQDAPGALDGPADGDIAFDNVSFSYDGRPVLQNVSFTVEKGSTLGILGGTGSGKTTIAHLLCRLHELDDGCGSITIGGVDIRKFKLASLRGSIGIVLQEPFLFSRTIKDNIASLSPTQDLEAIRRAARASCIDDSIERFGSSYNTVVGERGVTLSGGQKQRVAIARAILNNPPVMVFDDSLSAVDTETDTRIRTALRERTGGATVIIIAHRLTSLSKADKIIVLDKGRVIEMGTHSQLLEQNGVYRRVYDMQSSIGDGDNGGEATQQ